MLEQARKSKKIVIVCTQIYCRYKPQSGPRTASFYCKPRLLAQVSAHVRSTTFGIIRHSERWMLHTVVFIHEIGKFVPNAAHSWIMNGYYAINRLGKLQGQLTCIVWYAWSYQWIFGKLYKNPVVGSLIILNWSRVMTSFQNMLTANTDFYNYPEKHNFFKW